MKPTREMIERARKELDVPEDAVVGGGFLVRDSAPGTIVSGVPFIACPLCGKNMQYKLEGRMVSYECECGGRR